MAFDDGNELGDKHVEVLDRFIPGILEGHPYRLYRGERGLVAHLRHQTDTEAPISVAHSRQAPGLVAPTSEEDFYVVGGPVSDGARHWSTCTTSRT